MREILEKKLSKGIVQGDSFMFLLFVFCMDSLSQALGGKYSSLSVATGGLLSYLMNHLLFIVDFKLLVKTKDVLIAMLSEIEYFFEAAGLEMNQQKLVTNILETLELAALLDGSSGYKYLIIVKDSLRAPMSEGFEKVLKELLCRVKSQCLTKLNARYLFYGFNEHALLLVNYHVSVFLKDLTDYEKLDYKI